MSWLWIAGLLWAGFNAALPLILWRWSAGEPRKEEALIAELYADIESRGPQWFVEAVEEIEGHDDA